MADLTRVDVLRVFTDDAGAFGNPLGIVGSSPATAGREQAIATELGFSETVFVDDVTGDAARLRIFTPAVELPFAGHPTVGTAWWLRENGRSVAYLDVPAGRLEVATDGDATWITAAASWSPDFVWHPCATPAGVDAIAPAAFESGAHYAWAWLDEASGLVRARMFGPAMGVAEDEATGSAAVRLTALLERDLVIHQGEGSVVRTRFLSGDRVAVGGRTVADGSRVVCASAAPISGMFDR